MTQGFGWVWAVGDIPSSPWEFLVTEYATDFFASPPPDFGTTGLVVPINGVATSVYAGVDLIRDTAGISGDAAIVITQTSGAFQAQGMNGGTADYAAIGRIGFVGTPTGGESIAISDGTTTATFLYGTHFTTPATLTSAINANAINITATDAGTVYKPYVTQTPTTIPPTKDDNPDMGFDTYPFQCLMGIRLTGDPGTTVNITLAAVVLAVDHYEFLSMSDFFTVIAPPSFVFDSTNWSKDQFFCVKREDTGTTYGGWDNAKIRRNDTTELFRFNIYGSSVG